MNHLPIWPILFPLVVAAVLLLVDDRRWKLKAVVGTSSFAVQLVIAWLLLGLVDSDTMPNAVSYRVGAWPASFGIVLVVDRLSAMMLVLAATVAIPTCAFGSVRWQRAGSRFHVLFQLLIMGLNGAFLTGDLFNLFVFFEVLLAASYGLALHGSGPDRVRAGLQYVAVNLVGSFLLLVGISLIYGVTGTLGMAELAGRIPALTGEERALADSAAALLGVAFLLKAGIWPLCFWLPTTYAAASAPVAAMFAIMTKVGVYVILRLGFLIFGAGPGEPPRFGAGWLLAAGLLTIVFGMIGALASHSRSRLAGYCAIVSSGTLVAVIGTGNDAAVAGSLYYLAASTLGLAAFFLLIEVVERGRDPATDDFLLTMVTFEAEDDLEPGEEEIGIAIPGMLAFLGLAFVGSALVLSGMPPLPGFVGKFAMLTALLGPAGPEGAGAIPALTWVVVGLLIVSGLALLIATMRAGVNAIWTREGEEPPVVNSIELGAVGFLLAACVGMMLWGGPIMRYLDDAARSLSVPGIYIEGVFPQETALGGEEGPP